MYLWMDGKLASSHLQIILGCMVLLHKSTPIIPIVYVVAQPPGCPFRVEALIFSSLFYEIDFGWKEIPFHILHSPWVGLQLKTDWCNNTKPCPHLFNLNQVWRVFLASEHSLGLVEASVATAWQSKFSLIQSCFFLYLPDILTYCPQW